MALACKTCGALNTANNNYCAQCGTKLEQTAPSAAYGAWPGPGGGIPAGYVPASAHLPPEPTSFEQTPLAVGELIARRLPPPPERVEQDHLQQGERTRLEARAADEAERKRREEMVRRTEADLESIGVVMRWNVQDTASAAARAEATSDATVQAAAEPAATPSATSYATSRATQPLEHRNLPTNGGNIEGQQTLRASAPPLPVRATDAVSRRTAEGRTVESYSRRDSQRSSFRGSSRNIIRTTIRSTALAVLAAAVILAAVQWRTLRDYALPYLWSIAQQAMPQPMPQPMQAAPPPPALATPAPAANVSGKEPASAAARSTAKPRPRAPSAPGLTNPASSVSDTTSTAEAKPADAGDDGVVAARLWIAVAGGNPQATVELAKMYEEGDGVAQSCDQARLLLNAAAAKGNAQAKLNLQRIERGGGCSQQ
jgi:hypothetical protein